MEDTPTPEAQLLAAQERIDRLENELWNQEREITGLKQQAYMAQRLQTFSHVGTWNYHPLSQTLELSAYLTELLEFPTDRPATLSDLTSRIAEPFKSDLMRFIREASPENTRIQATHGTTTPSGNHLTVRHFAKCFFTEGGVSLKYSGLIDDISDLIEKEEQLAQERESAVRANTAKTAFLSNMSHEIRTPLNSVIGTLELLRHQTPESDANASIINQAIASSQSLLSILNDVLDVTQLETGGIQLNPTATDIAELVRTVEREFHASAERKGLKLRIQPIGDLDSTWFEVDSLRVLQIMRNLVSNAVKFTDKGSIKMVYGARKDGSGFDFNVLDTGIGFDSTLVETLFSRFQQQDNSIKRKFGGAGLGLAIVKELADLMGAKVDANSAAGMGSVFSISIPAKPAAPLKKSRENVDQFQFPDMGGMTVLVTDDDMINRAIAQSILKKCNINVLEAMNGEEAVAAAENPAIDFILMDIHMPVMDGKEAAKKIKASRPDLAICAFTADTTDAEIRVSQDSGFDAVLYKPFDIQQIVATIKSLVN